MPHTSVSMLEKTNFLQASDGEKPSVKKMSFAVSGDDVYLFDKETEKIIVTVQ